MALMKCNRGHLFEEEDKAVWIETYGEFQEEETGCPYCYENYEEAKHCFLCGRHYTEDELTEGVCDDCLNSFNNNIDVCFEVGSKESKDIALNSMLVELFNSEQIEEILLRELKEAGKIDCSAFINSDKEWFVENLLEYLNKDE